MKDDNNQLNNNIYQFKSKISKENKKQNFLFNNENRNLDTNISNINNINYSDYSKDPKNYPELFDKKQLFSNQKNKENLSRNNCLSSIDIRYQIKETQIIKMENEIKNLKNKCSLLEEKNRQMIESREKILKTLKDQKNSLIFPPPDRIPCEKLYEGYTKLYEAFNKISNDKEVAVVSLQNEILMNDQQRNYIEILKQTLESNLLKNGMKSQLEIYSKIQKEKNNEECLKNEDNIQEGYEEIFNTVGLNKKIEDLFRKNKILEIENNKLVIDIKELTERNNSFREQINNSLKNGIKELEQAKYKIKELESQNQQIIDENNLLKKYNEKLKLKFESFQQENVNINNYIQEFQKKNKEEINEYKSKNGSIQDEYQILKNNYEKLQENNELILRKNEVLEEQINVYKQENESLINEINNMKEGFNYNSQNNNFQSFTNNNNELDHNNRNSFGSISMKCNATNLTGQRYFDNNNSEFGPNNTNMAQITSNFSNTNDSNIHLSNNKINELKNSIYNCLTNCNDFINFCFSKFKESELIEEEIKEKEIWNNFINNITYLCQLFQNCYNTLNDLSNNSNTNVISAKKNKNNKNNFTKYNSSKAKTAVDTPPLNMTLSNTGTDSFHNTNTNIDKNKQEINNINLNDNQELLILLEKYKEDNRIIYKNYKKLENENVELFFVNKENKFYYKLISRMLQYHISNKDVKTIINKLVMLNGKAIELDMEKNKIKLKIDDITCSISSLSLGQDELGINSKLDYDNELYNSEEIDKLKKMFSTMEKELNDKYISLKNLDKELKAYEKRE